MPIYPDTFGNLRRGLRGAATGSALVTPQSLTRVALASVTDGGATTADSAAILASAANRRNARLATTGAARDFVLTLSAPVAGTGGALLFMDGAFADAGWDTVVITYSTDGTAPSLAATSYLFAPAGSTIRSNRGQFWKVPAGTTAIRIQGTFSQYAYHWIGLVLNDVDPKKNAIYGFTGTSVEEQSLTSSTVIDAVNRANPAGDVLCLDWGRTGGKVADIRTESHLQIPAKAPHCAYWMTTPWTNEVFQIARGVSPFVYAGDTSAAKANITNGAAAMKAHADANGYILDFGEMTFADYLANSPNAGSGSPAVDQAGANGGPFPQNGNAPYNNAEVSAAIQLNSPGAWDAGLGKPHIDSFSRSLVGYTDWLLASDRLHPSGAGSLMHQLDAAKWVAYRRTGTWSVSFVEEAIALYEGNGSVPAATKAMLTYTIGQWPAATTAAQTTARNALLSRITAIATAYADPALTGGAVLPSAMTGIRDWWDGSDHTRMTAGKASANGSTPAAMGLVGAVAAIASRGPAASQLVSANDAGRPTFAPKGAISGARGALDFASRYQVLTSALTAASGAAVIGALDAGGRDLIVALEVAPSSLYKNVFDWTAGAASFRMVNVGAGRFVVQDSGTTFLSDGGADTADGAAVCIVVACLNGAWTIYRNGVSRGTATRNLSARTGSAFTLGNSIGRMQEFWFQTAAAGGLAQADVNSAIETLRQMTGAY